MARRSHGCLYMASVDLVEMELLTNMAAANNYMQISLKNQSNVLSSYIIRLVHLESPHFSSFLSSAAIAGKTSAYER